MENYPLKAKPVVHYRPSPNDYIKMGESAWVFPIDHTSDRVSNRTMVCTSTVIQFNPIEGGFETANSVYVPVKL